MGGQGFEIKALLDELQPGSVVRGDVRHLMGRGKGRDDNQGNAVTITGKVAGRIIRERSVRESSNTHHESVAVVQMSTG